MTNILKKALAFYKERARSGKEVVKGKEFPNEYIRKALFKAGLLFPVKRGLYLLKNKGEGDEHLLYTHYWQVIEKLLKAYAPWSIEKESALSLRLGDESIPSLLKVRTARNVKYLIKIPFGLKILIRPDLNFHPKTSEPIAVGGARACLDIPEKILFNIRKKSPPAFFAFIKATKFNPRMLEALYARSPKPVITKELAESAKEIGKDELFQILEKILKEYTLYRPSRRRKQ